MASSPGEGKVHLKLALQSVPWAYPSAFVPHTSHYLNLTSALVFLSFFLHLPTTRLTKKLSVRTNSTPSQIHLFALEICPSTSSNCTIISQSVFVIPLPPFIISQSFFLESTTIFLLHTSVSPSSSPRGSRHFHHRHHRNQRILIIQSIPSIIIPVPASFKIHNFLHFPLLFAVVS